MADVPAVRSNIQVPAVQFRSSVSESTWGKIAGSINFINNFQSVKMEFGILKGDVNSGSPSYASISTPFLNFGGMEVFQVKAAIVGIEIISYTPGSGGTTELDLKWASSNSGSFSSIFSTTPKATSASPSNAQFDTFGNATTPTGCTVPVLSKTTFNAGDVLRCDILSVMSGNPNGFMLGVYYRPN